MPLSDCLKFKQLLHSGKKVHFDIKSVTGKATIHLTVEGDISNQHPDRVQPRNGPARQRRHEKRAAARDEAAAEAAVENVNQK